jgi:hypothetical protein
VIATALITTGQSRVFLATSGLSSAAGSPDGWQRVFPFLDAHSGAITAVATVVLVIVTVAYVILTRQLVEETRRDSDAAYQPALTWKIDGDDKNERNAQIVNNGQTGAFYCILVSADSGSSWFRTAPVDIGHGETAPSIKMARQDVEQPSDLDLSVTQCLCRNQFGRMFCYKQGTTDVSIWHPSTKRRRRGPRKPPWVNWYEAALKTHTGI